VAHGKSGKKISLDEVIDILEDLALRYAEKADSENTLGNPRGMRQDLWKSKGIIEAADLLRKMFRS
jgi:signal recognition particle subunit SEC65